jgi:hypothetical protein
MPLEYSYHRPHHRQRVTTLHRSRVSSRFLCELHRGIKPAHYSIANFVADNNTTCKQQNARESDGHMLFAIPRASITLPFQRTVAASTMQQIQAFDPDTPALAPPKHTLQRTIAQEFNTAELVSGVSEGEFVTGPGITPSA